MYRKSRGFTLLEILMALFIFAIVSMLLVRGLHTVLNAQSATEKKAERLTQLQIALTLMAQDFEQAIDRPVTNATGTVEQSFLGTTTNVLFTRAGLVNPLGQLSRSTLQRVRYQMANGNLTRETWQVLDQAQQSQPSSRVILKNVVDFHFEYLDKDGHFHNKWPTEEQQSQQQQRPQQSQQQPQPNNEDLATPRAIKVFITIKNWGKITQLYVMPGQKIAKPN